MEGECKEAIFLERQGEAFQMCAIVNVNDLDVEVDAGKRSEASIRLTTTRYAKGCCRQEIAFQWLRLIFIFERWDL